MKGIKKMTPLFKNKTKYTEKNYQQFVNFHTKKYNFSYYAYTIIMAILMAYCCILAIVQKDFGLAVLFAFMFVIFLVLRIYVPGRRYLKTKKDLKNEKSNSFTFNFYQHYFTIGKSRLYYFKLHKVFETKDYFYLYVDEDNAALVSKSGFEIGTPADFTNFIKKKCLLKYSKQTS